MRQRVDDVARSARSLKHGHQPPARPWPAATSGTLNHESETADPQGIRECPLPPGRQSVRRVLDRRNYAGACSIEWAEETLTSSRLCPGGEGYFVGNPIAQEEL